MSLWPSPNEVAVFGARRGYLVVWFNGKVIQVLGKPPGASPEGERDPECVKRWPSCSEGEYDPRCCRFPKSCSCAASPEGER